MRFRFTTAILAATVGVLPAYAQFGSGIVYDPTQSGHAIVQIEHEEQSLANQAQQIENGQQIFTNTVKIAATAIQTYNTVQQQYNLYHQMMLAPQMLYSRFLSPMTDVQMLEQVSNTYNNSAGWVNSANTGNGAAAAYQQASVPRTGQINGYGNLSTLGQQQIAAQGATVDLNDSVTTSNMQTLGMIRFNSQERQTDINALISASLSSDPAQHTEMAALQRINKALILLIQEQLDANQIGQAVALQQIVGQKVQQDNLKSLFITANGYQQNFNAVTPQQTSAGTNWAFHY